ncbi:MAG TPA: flagellar export chaperone FlgN [Opitutaceae bacterium]|nr:flagellar export chaperone FlgN [Opitutaceae bacterium]
MNARWEQIAECLREEIAEYGGLLHLFEVQQQALTSRDPAATLRHGNGINAIARKLAECRSRRDKVVDHFAAKHGFPPETPVLSLLPFIKADARPLLKALVDETNHLLRRVRRASRRNHTLLTGAAVLQQETLSLLRASAVPKPNSRGNAGSEHHSALRAAG